jgi:hypothetical protein
VDFKVVYRGVPVVNGNELSFKVHLMPGCIHDRAYSDSIYSAVNNRRGPRRDGPE